MTGICKPKDTGVIVCGDGTNSVIIGVYKQQRWEFEVLPSSRVSLHRKCITIHTPRLQFDEDWDIIEVMKE